jgi:phenylalanyl-tRNA synthetase beta chain
LLDALSAARRHGERDVRMFTLGATFLPSGGARLPRERLGAAAVLAGDRLAHLTRPEPVDVWDAKGVVVGAVERLARTTPRVVPMQPHERPKHLHPRGAARVVVGDVVVGAIGPLHPEVGEAFDLDGGVMIVELDLEALAEVDAGHPRFRAIPRFPASTRDIALVVHESVAAGDVERVVREAAGALATEVRLFDRFTGGSVPAEHASLAFRVVYRAADRTLTDAEVDAQHAGVVKQVGEKLGATLRA